MQDWLVSFGQLTEGPIKLTLALDQAGREEIAARLGVLAVDQFEVTGSAGLDEHSTGAYFRGKVHGVATQACRVSLDPIIETVEQEIDVLFVRAKTDTSASQPHEPEEAGLGGDAADTEPVTGESFDVLEIATQYFALALDPYPRKADADSRFLATEEEAETGDKAAKAEASPFAVLKKLKDNA